jgi:hypothetical protein
VLRSGPSASVVLIHPSVPGVSKTAQAFIATRCLEDSLHVPMMTILSCLCKALTPGPSRGSDIPRGAKCDSFVTTFKD